MTRTAQVEPVRSRDPEPPAQPYRPPPADGSLGRAVASMVGIVAIILLGSLFWSALGAFVAAWGDVGSSLPGFSRPTHFLTAEPTLRTRPTQVPQVAAVVPTPAAATTAASTPVPSTPAPEPIAAPTSPPAATPTPMPQATPTADAGQRAPWVLLPQPAPGTRVASGSIQIEARGRGDAPIKEIRLELDGAALPVSLEQRSDSIWRGYATAAVGAGPHAVRAQVTDANGRTGAYRWTFDAQ